MKKEQSGIGEADLSSEKPLQSWKEIATYLERDQRTARRWEKEEALPIRRHREGQRSSVYAYRTELDAWRIEREPKAGKTEQPLFVFRVGAPLAISVLVAGVAFWFVQYGPVFNPPNPFVEAADGITIRQVWAEPRTDRSGEASPDGSLLSFVDWATGDLSVRDLVAGKDHRLTRTADWFKSGEFALESVFSPDGKQIAYTWHNRDYCDDLRLIRVDGSGLRVLYKDGGVESIRLVDWLPDASQILVMLEQNDGVRNIALISANDGSMRTLKRMDSILPGAMSLSPDGRFLVYDFVPWRNHSARDISLLSLADLREVPLVVDSANDLYPLWTPEGEGMVFTSDRTGTMGLWALQITKGKPEGSPRLVKADIGRFVPMNFTQEGALYFGLEAGMSDVYSVNMDLESDKILGEATRISQRFVGSNFCPEWSSDGELLSYLSTRSSLPDLNLDSNIVIRDLGTGQEREIVPKLPSFLLFRWSPDGQTFVTRGQDENGQNGIFLISSQSGEVRAVFQSDSGTFLGFPIWSHDGQAIFYQRFDSKNRREAFVCRDLGSGIETELLQVRPPDYLDNLTLSRDGKCLAYVFGNRETGQQAIHVLPVDADHSRELLQVQGRGFVVTSLEWTRNDKELLFVKTSGDGKRSQVYELMAVMSEGGEPRRLRVFKDYIRDLRLHPEGNVLAFAMGRREIEVWVMEGFLSKVTGAE